tara:strand:- start:1018 stop:1356 length:339 start_codon:yes stop_codon:yes gene_type:complete
MSWKNILKARGSNVNRWGGRDWDYPIWVNKEGEIYELYSAYYNDAGDYAENYAEYKSIGADRRVLQLTKDEALELEADLKDVPEESKDSWDKAPLGHVLVDDLMQYGDIEDD